MPENSDTHDGDARKLLARVIDLSPRVFPSVAVDQEWRNLLGEAQLLLKDGQPSVTKTSPFSLHR